MITNILPDRLIFFRRLNKLSQTELCGRLIEYYDLNINQKKYAAYESGKNEPNINTIKAISLHYGITMDELCFGENKK